MINENMMEKTNILDRLHKAEFRNLELENTIKTLYTKIESFQNRQNQHPPEHQNTTSTATDDLVIGIPEKVTKYVLSKVDDEINKLQNENKNTNNDTLNRQNQTSYDYKQMYPSNQQLYYRDRSYNQNYGEPPTTIISTVCMERSSVNQINTGTDQKMKIGSIRIIIKEKYLVNTHIKQN
ncbi:unnamed protein product [Mytilus coruscus]|uniref:Uncharacterized protein n=1 Tax=Mytilus coruscus TaxID=42192 RepID=A0A6J8DT14_MYTCO|nr:unnamed protein product [Mytilus coruscus]